jgi:hypothetical protein
LVWPDLLTVDTRLLLIPQRNCIAALFSLTCFSFKFFSCSHFTKAYDIDSPSDILLYRPLIPIRDLWAVCCPHLFIEDFRISVVIKFLLFSYVQEKVLVLSTLECKYVMASGHFHRREKGPWGRRFNRNCSCIR